MARFGTTVFPRIRIGIGAGRYIYLPVLTTTQRDLLSASAGFLIYNSTTTQLENYNGSAWVASGKVYGDATFLPLVGGTMSGNIAMAGAQTVDGVDISAHDADLDAHTRDIAQVWKTGEYYVYGIGAGYGFITLVANKLLGIPFLVARSMTFDRIAIQVTTLADPSNIRLGIYNDGTNLYPGTLLLDAGVVSGATTGVKAITISQALTKGLYWLALVSDATPILYSTNPGGDVGSNPLGRNVDYMAFGNSGYTVSFTYAALPTPFTAGGTFYGASLAAPLIALRLYSLD